MKKIISKLFSEEIDDSLLFKYDDEEFSKLMLIEHLDQNSFGASRARSFIKREVEFISKVFSELNIGRNLLDIGCGPGFYCDDFNYSGYSCDGVDMSPSVIEFAKNNIRDSQFHCCKIQELISQKKYDAALVLFGLLNEIEDADSFISSTSKHIKGDGYLVLEVMHPHFFNSLVSESINVSGRETPSCFSKSSHVRVTKRFFSKERDCLVNRSMVVDDNGMMKLYESHFTCYDLEKATRLLESNGFMDVQCVQSPQTGEFSYESYYHYIIAKKRPLD
ncbi:class I SAM-dependent methyltransferase [Vibrio tritonius]|uniref:class I SAM-dependent methyltransferase n=1 Tax=Vibrio tritonius TaxID=1435069 RepID=UPI0008393905|nr:class I SAM-dependent methyltransferase [Vibrio tritonius]